VSINRFRRSVVPQVDDPLARSMRRSKTCVRVYGFTQIDGYVFSYSVLNHGRPV
jgi:hypothetical protein